MVFKIKSIKNTKEYMEEMNLTLKSSEVKTFLIKSYFFKEKVKHPGKQIYNYPWAGLK